MRPDSYPKAIRKANAPTCRANEPIAARTTPSSAAAARLPNDDTAMRELQRAALAASVGIGDVAAIARHHRQPAASGNAIFTLPVAGIAASPPPIAIATVAASASNAALLFRPSTSGDSMKHRNQPVADPHRGECEPAA